MVLIYRGTMFLILWIWCRAAESPWVGACLLTAGVFGVLGELFTFRRGKEMAILLYLPLVLWKREFLLGIPLLALPEKCIMGGILSAGLFLGGNPTLGLLEVQSFVFHQVFREGEVWEQKFRETRDEYRERNLNLRELLHRRREREITEKQLAIMEERNRISRELHDSVGHTITGSLLQLEALSYLPEEEKEPALGEVKRTLSQGMDEIRHVLHNLKKSSLVLEREVEVLLEKTGKEYSFTVREEGMSLSRKFQILSIVKEAVTNSLKHSDATFLRVRILSQPKFDSVSVTDNGSTFVNTGKLSFGMGLYGMKEVAEETGGTFSLRYDNGLRITVILGKEEL